jgi:hypothetical protein
VRARPEGQASRVLKTKASGAGQLCPSREKQGKFIAGLPMDQIEPQNTDANV